MLNVLATNEAFSPNGSSVRIPIAARHRLKTNLFESPENNDEAERLQEKAKELREQIRKMEENLPATRGNNNAQYIPAPKIVEIEEIEGKSLKGKTVLVVGANGRLGSMVTRYLLRNHPEVKEVLASVHYVGQASSRGYGRLSYEVGAEDGVGTIGAAWSEDRNAYFEYSDEMKDYNLNKLRVVEVELLDPDQCRTITEGVDSVIWCATDFEGNRPKAVASLDIAFLFRAVASPTKTRCEIEGMVNILGGLKQSKVDRKRVERLTLSESNLNARSASGDLSTVEATSSSSTLDGDNDPISFVLVSPAPTALDNYETPFGEFNAIKREGEDIVKNNYPSLTKTVLQMSRFEDNFVEESLELKYIFDHEGNVGNDDTSDGSEKVERSNRRINRRDAARAAVDALLDENLADKTVEIWTATRGR